MSRALMVAVFGVFATVFPVQAQVSSVTGPVADVPAAMYDRAVDGMTRDLQRLVVAMETYFTEKGTYVGELSKQERSKIYIVPSAGVTLSLTYSTRTAWTARATHDWLPGSSCVIFVGTVPSSRQIKTTNQGLVPAEEGDVACDRR